MPNARVGVEFYQEGLDALLQRLDDLVGKYDKLGAHSGDFDRWGTGTPESGNRAPFVPSGGGRSTFGTDPRSGGISGGAIAIYGGTYTITGGNWTVNVSSMTVNAQSVQFLGAPPVPSSGAAAAGAMAPTPAVAGAAAAGAMAPSPAVAGGGGGGDVGAGGTGGFWDAKRWSRSGVTQYQWAAAAAGLGAQALGTSLAGNARWQDYAMGGLGAIPLIGGWLQGTVGAPVQRSSEVAVLRDMLVSRGSGWGGMMDWGLMGYGRTALGVAGASLRSGMTWDESVLARLRTLPGGVSQMVAGAYTQTLGDPYNVAFGNGNAPDLNTAFNLRLFAGDYAGASQLAMGLGAKKTGWSWGGMAAGAAAGGAVGFGVGTVVPIVGNAVAAIGGALIGGAYGGSRGYYADGGDENPALVAERNRLNNLLYWRRNQMRGSALAGVDLAQMSALNVEAGAMGQLGYGTAAAGLIGQAAGWAGASAPHLEFALAQLNKQIAGIDPNQDPAAYAKAMNERAGLTAQLAQSRATVAVAPLQMSQSIYGEQAARPHAMGQMGGTVAGLLSGTGQVSGYGAAFGLQSQGLDGSISALEGHIGRLRGKVSDATIAPLEAQLVGLKAQKSMLGAQEAGAVYGAMGAVAGAHVSGAPTGLGAANLQHFFSGETAAAYDTIGKGLAEQLRVSREYLESLLKAKAGPALTEPIKAQIQGLELSMSQNIAAKVEQMYGDVEKRASTFQGMATSRLAGLGASGQMRGAAMTTAQAAQISRLNERIGNAAAEMNDPNASADARNAARGRLDALLAERTALQGAQIEQGASYGRAMAGREVALSVSNVGYLTTYGAGSLGALAHGLRGVQGVQGQIRIEEGVRAQYAATYGADSTVVMRKDEELAALRAQLIHQQTALASYQPNAGLAEEMGSAEYRIRVGMTVPGSLVNIRAGLQGKMGLLGRQASEIEAQEARLRASGALTPEMQYQLNQQKRQLGMEQASAFEQLSFGWESRLANMVINSSGNFAGVANEFVYRDAVGSGIEAFGHFGGTGQSIGRYIRRANEVPLVSTIAGSTGTKAGFFATAMERGGAADYADGAIPGFAGAVNMAPVVIPITIKLPDGTTQTQVATSQGGKVGQALGQGGGGELLFEIPAIGGGYQ